MTPRYDLATYLKNRDEKVDPGRYSEFGSDIHERSASRSKALLRDKPLAQLCAHGMMLFHSRMWNRSPDIHVPGGSPAQAIAFQNSLRHLYDMATMNGLNLQAFEWVALEMEGIGAMSYQQASLEKPAELREYVAAASAAMCTLAVQNALLCGQRRELSGIWPTEEDALEWKCRPADPVVGPSGKLSKVAAELLANLRSKAGIQPEELEPWGHALTLGALGAGGFGTGESVAATIAKNLMEGDDEFVRMELSLATSWLHRHPAASKLMERNMRQQRIRSASRAAHRLEQKLDRSKEEIERLSVSQPKVESRGLISEIDRSAKITREALLNNGSFQLGSEEDRLRRVAMAPISAMGELRAEAAELRPTLAAVTLDIDQGTASRMSIRLAALEMKTDRNGRSSARIIVNLGSGANERQWKRIILMLALKLALGHPWRGHGKDPRRWSLAGDLALAPVLDALEIGDQHPAEPRSELLEPLGSAEAIYARLDEDPKLLGKVQGTGNDQGNILGAGEDASALSQEEEEEWLRRLRDGLEEAQGLTQGLLAGETLRELRDRAALPIEWRPALTKVAQGWFPVVGRKRTYARPSRRLISPLEPRASRVAPLEGGYEMLVLIDTSGSVDDRVIEEALGGIRGLCGNLDVVRLRIFSCDAAAHDHGWQKPWNAGSGLRLLGGGGTSLQEGLDLIAKGEDIDPLTPLLIVTDGIFWEELRVGNRPHAFLMPPRSKLPFRTRAPVFTIRRA